MRSYTDAEMVLNRNRLYEVADVLATAALLLFLG
jgi:hypothetical protein